MKKYAATACTWPWGKQFVWQTVACQWCKEGARNNKLRPLLVTATTQDHMHQITVKPMGPEVRSAPCQFTVAPWYAETTIILHWIDICKEKGCQRPCETLGKQGADCWTPSKLLEKAMIYNGDKLSNEDAKNNVQERLSIYEYKDYRMVGYK